VAELRHLGPGTLTERTDAWRGRLDLQPRVV